MYRLFAFSPGLQGYVRWEGFTNDVLDFEVVNDKHQGTVIEKEEVARSYARSLTTLTEYIVDVEEKLANGK